MINIKCIDCIEGMKQLPDNSIDMILTDPPYDEKSIHLYIDTAKEARRVLKDGGVALYYGNDMFFDRILPKMCEHLDFFFLFHLYMPGQNTSIIKYNLRVGCKTIMAFSYGKTKLKHQISNYLVSPKRKTGELHKWQQNKHPVVALIEGFTNEGDVVLDMFLGSGTTGIACKMLKRQFIGFDTDSIAVENAIQYIANFKRISEWF